MCPRVAFSLRTDRGCSQISELKTRGFSKGIGHPGKASYIGLACWVEDMVGTKDAYASIFVSNHAARQILELSRKAVMVILHRNGISLLSTMACWNVQEHPAGDKISLFSFRSDLLNQPILPFAFVLGWCL